MVNKSFAVVGDPVTHSLSPSIHQAAYKYLGLDYSYRANQVSAGDLPAFVKENTTQFDGFSVTMPLKFEAAEIASKASDLLGTGVANTLVKTDSGWNGYNTDISGISFALAECFATSPSTVAVLGAGATARSALVTISQQGFSNVTICARNLTKASELIQLCNSMGLALEILSLDEFGDNQDLTINTLPNGAADLLIGAGQQSGWLLSANYAGSDAEFKNLFSPLQVVSGVEMLLGQALEQIRLFTGLDLDFSKVDSAALISAMRSAL
ncbi:MAG: shikimate dehydrogenase [Actinomycetes bacterium]